MATLKDVARDAGVSTATVSCCLSGKKPVKAETKMRVMDSIEKLKYIPNVSARNLKSYASNQIGIVLSDIDNLYQTAIFKGLSSHLQALNYNVSVAFSGNAPDVECSIIDNFISQNVAGLLIITYQPQNSEFFQSRILNYNIPVVFIDRNPAHIFVNYAGFQNYETTYRITESLFEKGYRDIGLVCGPFHFSSERECIDGYRDAFLHNQTNLNRNLICTTNMSKEDAFKAVLTSISQRRLDAIITTSENIAAGTIEVLSTKGIHIPKDIAVITFSEESWNISYRLPGVIYTSRSAFHLGSSAAELLIKNIQTPALFEPKKIVIKDSITEIPLSPKKKADPKPPSAHINPPSQKLKCLMVDLATSHSIQLLSDSFTKETDIELEFEFLPQNKMLDRIWNTIDSTREMYDMYTYDIPWLSYMIQNSLLADISDFVLHSGFDRSQLFEENLKNSRYEDGYYGMPIIGGSQIMFYRKDLFEKREIIKDFKKHFQLSLRPPKTWTEFNGVSKFFTREFNPDSFTEFGTSFAGITDEELAPEILIRLWAYGGALWDSYNRPCLDTPQNTKAFESILETLHYTEAAPFQTSINNTVDDFCHGKTAMLITYTEYAARISQSIHNNIIGHVGYELIPGMRPASIGWNLGLNPASPNHELAYRYFSWLCQKDISFYMTILDGQSTAIAPYHSQELLKLYPWLAITEKSFNYTQRRNGPLKRNTLIIPLNRIEEVLCNVMRNVLSDNIPIPDALAENQEKMKRLFAAYGYPRPFCR